MDLGGFEFQRIFEKCSTFVVLKQDKLKSTFWKFEIFAESANFFSLSCAKLLISQPSIFKEKQTCCTSRGQCYHNRSPVNAYLFYKLLYLQECDGNIFMHLLNDLSKNFIGEWVLLITTTSTFECRKKHTISIGNCNYRSL